ncbi:TM0106 family RecB-like putative nuclease [Mycolicibacterium palauense]|uniref:TM0106 family RecB-like putative nuclease n=1 Tax=Mycolicibacterium palauense TaxID=2034511 RepID=UPI000BFED86E|nr:TM0106 family RecB-like putative nuclease [Mycolicibacterium palauense]
MLVADGRVLYSASDLAAAARCEYALLRAFDAKLGRGPAVAEGDALLARTVTLGEEHERGRLEVLRESSARGEHDVAVIGRPAYTPAGLTAAAEATRRAVEDRVPVIYQAAVFDGRFLGFADFLVLDGDRYRVGDTKLARSAKVEALLQLAAYADALTAAGVPVAPEAELVLGTGVVRRYRVDEIAPVYRRRRAALQRLLDTHLTGGHPVRWEDDRIRACFRCPECAAKVRETDDLLRVANMRVSQRARLIDAGITTMSALATHRGPVPGLPVRAVDGLTEQARLQIAPRDDDRPPYRVADAQPLMVLPNPDRGDLFFDFEGDPLWTDDGHDWGLEYLFGVLDAGDGFHPLWAHDRAGERRALLDFLALVRKRRRRHPGMHIYHYAPYEKTALLRLAGRHGVGEDDVDDLLRNGVLVDLFPLLRKSIRVGTENYSLKSLEPLYMGAELRSGEVTTATDSITEYARYCELRDGGADDEAATLLKDIEEYNRYDCRSTRRLRDWLLARAIESGVPPLGAVAVSGAVAGAGPGEARGGTEDPLSRALSGFAGEHGAERSPEQTAVAMLAAARGYHQRENKPFWWAHFDRLNNPVDEWGDQSDVFLAEHAEVVADWQVPDGARKLQRRVRLTGAMAAGELHHRPFALYEPPAPAGLAEDTERRGCGSAEVAWCDDPDTPTEVVIIEREPKGAGVFDRLPFALTPGPPIKTDALQASIEATAAGVAAALPVVPATAVTDILRCAPPRTRGGAALPRSADAVADITGALLQLDGSYLAVHGPPGTGKTHTSGRVIARLINDHHWRIGVVAQSHAVVENLFRDAVAAGVPADLIAKKDKQDRDAAWQEIAKNAYASFLDEHRGCLVGGTAWDFANAGRIPRNSLDLLVIEEAGQFSLANTIAVASAAHNLLLLGDPQQLPQVSQGTHPEPVDESALGWLVAGHDTLPPERGYFLDRSYRMHPAVCAAVSQLSYQGRLRSHDAVTAERRLAGCPPGVRVLPVTHDGNSVESPEEARAVVAEVRRLLGRDWTEAPGRTRPLTQRDVLVVTPYNAQVVTLRHHLDAAGLDGVRAGTVDKFQGQQAPVVLFSMTASSIDDVPRGISFLLNRNRLNVAVSRAQYTTVIVQSPTLTEYLPGTPDGLLDLGAYLRLIEPDPSAAADVHSEFFTGDSPALMSSRHPG